MGTALPDRRAAVGRWALAACTLLLLSSADAQSPPPPRRPTAATSPQRHTPASAASTPSDAAAQAHQPAGSTALVSESTRDWWLALLATLVAGLGVVALLARRRARPDPVPTYSEGWQGIGGPSYAPRPVTVRVEPRTGRSETIGGTARTVPLPARQENARRPFGVPADFDAPAFLADARQSFVRLQSAWDRSDLHEIDECTTDEMFNALTHELRVRAGPSRTEVIELTASLLGIETAAG
ncbi:MAG TPA: TIM44-like domain-containing protein, partial [Burkholderiaceae bacterium]|nr:TIM44-like domain-containing protein [Burkholderiaceae bacterium]